MCCIFDIKELYNWKGFGKKKSIPDLRCYFGIRWWGWETGKNIVIVDAPGEVRTRNLQNASRNCYLLDQWEKCCKLSHHMEL